MVSSQQLCCSICYLEHEFFFIFVEKNAWTGVRRARTVLSGQWLVDDGRFRCTCPSLRSHSGSVRMHVWGVRRVWIFTCLQSDEASFASSRALQRIQTSEAGLAQASWKFMHCHDLGRSSLRCSRSYGRFCRHQTWGNKNTCCKNSAEPPKQSWTVTFLFQIVIMHWKQSNCPFTMLWQSSSLSAIINVLWDPNTEQNSAHSHNRVRTRSLTLFETLGSFEIRIRIEIFGRADCPQPQLNSDEQGKIEWLKNMNCTVASNLFLDSRILFIYWRWPARLQVSKKLRFHQLVVAYASSSQE